MTRAYATLLAFVGLLFCAPTAKADTTVCIDFYAYYSDNTSGAGDYWTSDAVRPQAGVKVRLVDTIYSFVNIANYADYNGTNVGCATFPTSAGRTYHVYVESETRVSGGNVVKVLDASTVVGGDFENTGTVYTQYLGTVADGTTLNRVHYLGGPCPSSPPASSPSFTCYPTRVLGAATWAILRRNGGLNSETVRIFASGCPTGSGSCYRDQDDALYTGSTRKFVIAHEVGHAVAAIRNGTQSTNLSYGAGALVCKSVPPTPTTNHSMDSKEYQSGAASEGLAHYYAAVAWNLSNQSDCTFRYYKPVDFNLDAVVDPSNVNCEGGPALATPPGSPPPPPIDAKDLLGDVCRPTFSNRGTEYDWLRFWWDMDTDQGLSTTDIFDIWDAADPYNWRATDSGSSDYPSDRIYDACDTLGFLSDWNAQGPSNGVHR